MFAFGIMRVKHSVFDDFSWLKERAGCGRSRLHSAVSILLATTLIIAIVGPAQAMVVCVGANGHVNFELALGGCASSSQSDEDLPQPRLGSTHSECVGCTDLRVNMPGLQTNAHRLTAPGPNVVEGAAFLTSIPLGLGEMPLTDFSCSSSFPTLDLLATVVLLN